MPQLLERPYATPIRRRKSHSLLRGQLSQWVWYASVANFCAVCAVLVLVKFVSEKWWLSMALVYLPRSPYLLPPLVLGICACFCSRRSVFLNLGALVLVAGPLMGARLHFSTPIAPADRQPGDLCIVSCNVQRYEPDFGLVLNELTSIKPDVVVFQEASGTHPMLDAYFKGWYVMREEEFFIASRYPVVSTGTCMGTAFGRLVAAEFEVHAPQGKFQVYDIHQSTARHGLTSLTPRALVSEEAHRECDEHTRLREQEAFEARTFVERQPSDMPRIILGDFNMPSDASIFESSWSDFSNAFDNVGFGYGYSAPCHTHARWPEGMPWSRVDHILTSDHWDARACWIGQKDGSDHRLIAAILRLREIGPHRLRCATNQKRVDGRAC